MMVTKRTPIARVIKSKTTPETVMLFRRMRELESKCSCHPIDASTGSIYSEPCKACEQWLDLNTILCAELRLPPWDFPAYPHPSVKGKPDPDAVERFHMLQAAELELVDAT